MRPPIYFLLILLLTACKREDRLDPLPPQTAESPNPSGILGFTVRGVPQENIRFTTLGKDKPNDRVVITLPEDYSFADSIFVSMKLAEGYQVISPFQEKLNSNGFSLNYKGGEGYGFYLLIVDSATGNTVTQLFLNVDPLKSIVVPSVGHNYSFVLKGESIFVFLPVFNWGTDQTVSGKEFGQTDSLIDNYVLFRNLKTGSLSTSNTGHYLENENGYMFLKIPPEMEAGDYEMTLVRHDRRAIVPDKLTLKYGAPRSFEFYSASIFNQEGNIVTYKGFNLLPGHTYEIELSSAHFSKQRFPLIPLNRLEMIGHLPLELATGTYKAALYIDGEAESYLNIFTKYNLVLIHKEQRQPALLVISQPSLRIDHRSGNTVYEAAASLKRSEPVLAQYQGSPLNPGVPSNDSRLLLMNAQTGAEYSLLQTGFTTGVLPYRMYKSPSELPAGMYQVRFGIRYSPEGTEYVSGLYYEEIEVE